MNKPGPNWSKNAVTWRRAISLKARLWVGAMLLGACSLLTALILWFGMNAVAERLDAALASETRMARYSALSTQTATFLVVASEAVQSGLPADARTDRIEPVASQLRRTFEHLQQDVQQAVEQAEALGIDAQSRHGTQSLELARMQAMLNNTLAGLQTDTGDKNRLRTHIDTFASSFDPLLSRAVNTELLFRNAALSGIDDIRRKITGAAFGIACLTLLLVLVFIFGLVRPQFQRLDRLRAAATQIGQADFAVTLPETQHDEIGQLYNDTNRMAAALMVRQTEVEAEWARLNETIANRTEALRAANATLAEIDENRRNFFADISHELRTPLTVILMEAQIGRKGSDDPDQAFATIEARASRLNRRIDDLLRVARSDTGQLALDRQPVVLPELMSEIVSDLQPEIDSAGMSLTLSDVPDQTLLCDRNWIRQVLVGLVRNAIRHARGGKNVALDVQTDGVGVNIDIIDNGPGIPPDAQTRIFQRFEQGGVHNAQGFGVGLALARWVISDHDGQITLTSPMPRGDALGAAPGTKISVRLPLASTKIPA